MADIESMSPAFLSGGVLELRDVVAGYEEVEVLRNAPLAVRAGEIVCIIGANGAGC